MILSESRCLVIPDPYYIWDMRIHEQLFNRLLLTFKLHTYVIHTYAPFPSVLAVLPHKAKIIQPLLNQLSKKTDFELAK